MDSAAVIEQLKQEQSNLEAMGLKRVSLFGSTAKGSAGEASDIDLAVELDAGAGIDLFRLAAIANRLTIILGTRVDLVPEPARNPRIQAEIDRDRVRVY